MKFQVNKDVLSDAVAFAARMLQTKPTSQILSGMRLVADGNSLQISVFDHDVSAQTDIAANVEEPGICLVSGRLLNEYISELPNQPVTFNSEGSKITLSCGSTKIDLTVLPIEQYPTLPSIPAVTGTIDGDKLATAIRRVGVASAKESTRPFQRGIQIKTLGSGVMFTAADPNRIARCKVDWTSNSTEENSVVVLTKTMQDIEKSFGNLGEVNICMASGGESKIVAFQAKNRTVTTVVLNIEVYPDIDQYFPNNLTDSVVVNRQELIEATKIVEIAARQSEDTIRYSFEPDSVTLDASSSESQASKPVAAVLQGNPINLRFKPGLFIDGLNQTTGEFVKIEFAINQRDPQRPGPIIMSSQTSKDTPAPDSYRYLLNPNMLKR